MMSPEEKDILLLKMLNDPGTLSEQEICQIMAEDELRELSAISAELKQLYAPSVHIDADKEWAVFRCRIQPRRHRNILRWYYAAAAVFAGLIIVSVVLLYLNGNSPDSRQTCVLTKADSIFSVPLHQVDEDTLPTQASEAKKAAVSSSSAENRVISVAKKRNVSRKRPAPTVKDVDVEEYLRLEQARIDNEIALQKARIQEARLRAECEWMQAMNVDCDCNSLIKEINNVIAQ